ncbi:MAG: pyrimidine 5'-nucleotidase [Roseiflexaceae bacterium]|jgi:putative hydrolase of the HAD superfamily|nr:pyrimidine 5'-nucleotidase [Chloroflexaceae bacterium]
MPINALLFDLDNTLYPANSGVTEALEVRMNSYVQQVTGLPLAAARDLRQQYFVTYGTTLRGLQLHHQVDVEDYLITVHQLEIEALVQQNHALCNILLQDARMHVIFTNSPVEHATRVIEALGLTTLSLPIIDIRALAFEPKPHHSAYQVAIRETKCRAEEIVFFEDTLHNLAPAKSLGMTTVYIGRHLTSLPAYVDMHFPDIVTALTQL